MNQPFEKSFFVRWGEVDFNGHMQNTAYLECAADVRMLYFAAHDFPMSEFQRLQLGPVVLQDMVEYYKELRLLETFRVTLLLVGYTADLSRIRIRNEFFRADGKLAARITSLVTWVDWTTRKITTPPEKLATLFRASVRSDDFALMIEPSA